MLESFVCFDDYNILLEKPPSREVTRNKLSSNDILDPTHLEKTFQRPEGTAFESERTPPVAIA